MRIRAYSVFLFYCLLIVVTAGCSSKSGVIQTSNSTPPAGSPQQSAPVPGEAAATNTQSEQQSLSAEGGTANGKTDACSLITKPEIEAVQGEAVKETKSSDRSNGSFAIAQCFYTLATFNKSVSLEVTRSATANQSVVKEFWNHTFHKKEKEGEEAEKDRGKGEEKDRGKGEAAEEEEGAPPEPVSGIGDEAFWTGGRVGGALYVLKGNAFIRISVGGPGDEAAKIEKLKALARKALARL